MALCFGDSPFCWGCLSSFSRRPELRRSGRPNFPRRRLTRSWTCTAIRSARGVFYETLPPGLVIRQVRAGALCIGNLLVTAQPDVLLTGPRGMRSLQQLGKVSAWHPYASNTLAILVRAGNPLGIHSLLDLGRASVRVVMPNPK